MSKSILEIVNGIKEGAATTDDKGVTKVNRNFNRGTFDEVVKGLLNDTDYEADVVTKRNEDGTVVTKKVNVAKEFRNGTLKPILEKFGVDKVEAAEIENIEIEKVGGMYEIVSEGLELYQRTGKKFNFLPKEDLSSSIFLDEIEEETKDFRVPGTDDTVRIKTSKHMKQKVKAVTPANKKEKL